MECKIYALELLERFNAYAGRIGHYCDTCNQKECHHHRDNMKVEVYALAKLQDAK